MADTRDLVQELSLGGKTIDGNSAVFLRSDRHGVPVWMFYRLWRRDHVTGQFNSSGGKTLCYSHP